MNALRSTSSLSVHEIPLHFVYSYPTVSELCAFLGGLLSGKTIDRTAQLASQPAQMKALVNKFCSQFPKPQWQKSEELHMKASATGEVVIITGTTGGLGSHVLSQLLRDNGVSRVYVLNRQEASDSHGLERRQRHHFAIRGLDVELLAKDKVSFHAADFTKADLGLGQHLYQEVRFTWFLSRRLIFINSLDSTCCDNNLTHR